MSLRPAVVSLRFEPGADLPDLHAVFQPIVRSASGVVEGYEGLIRGPEEGPFRLPGALFEAARESDRLAELELRALEVIVRTFARRGLGGSLFLNISATVLTTHGRDVRAMLRVLNTIGLSADRIVIELTESDRIADFGAMRALADELRRFGFRLAVDDLGEGFASLKVWKELAPEFVKIDRHFIAGVDRDALKRQFLRAMQDIGLAAQSRLIAEGVETAEEFQVVQDLKIPLAQGHFIAHPSEDPPRAVVPGVAALARRVFVYPEASGGDGGEVAGRLAVRVEPVEVGHTGDEVFARFNLEPALQAVPVVHEGKPLGVISRFALIDRFARPFRRELFGRRSCTSLMNPAPVIVEAESTLQEVGWRLSALEERHDLGEGVIVVERGRYVGMCSGVSLLKELSEMQVRAARYANPLTQLPGNVPVTQHIERLIEAGLDFRMARADLDSFKPFNDIYGYRKGDEMIQLAAAALSAEMDRRCDLTGHVGGDDFIVVMQSDDWFERLNAALRRFDASRMSLFGADDIARGGFVARDRRGESQFYPLTTLSIGVTEVAGGLCPNAHDVAVRASEAKSEAKRMRGSCVFVDRRSYDGVPKLLRDRIDRHGSTARAPSSTSETPRRESSRGSSRSAVA